MLKKRNENTYNLIIEHNFRKYAISYIKKSILLKFRNNLCGKRNFHLYRETWKLQMMIIRSSCVRTNGSCIDSRESSWIMHVKWKFYKIHRLLSMFHVINILTVFENSQLIYNSVQFSLDLQYDYKFDSYSWLKTAHPKSRFVSQLFRIIHLPSYYRFSEYDLWLLYIKSIIRLRLQDQNLQTSNSFKKNTAVRVLPIVDRLALKRAFTAKARKANEIRWSNRREDRAKIEVIGATRSLQLCTFDSRMNYWRRWLIKSGRRPSDTPP